MPARTATNSFIRTNQGGVAYVRDEIRALLPQYELIRDCLAGEKQIKHRREAYLPKPSPEDTSKENEARYQAYLKRAVFYNVTKRTLNGLVGQIFMREPVIEVPTLLDALVLDVTGSGVSLEQLAKKATSYVIAFGRAGIYADYPAVAEPATRKDIEEGDIRPTISCYAPWEAINWRTIVRGGRELLSLVVLAERYVVQDDGFEQKKEDQFRVLKLVDNTYVVEVWRKKGGGFFVAEAYIPTDATGNMLDEIPFVFVGTENNDTNPDNPPLYDLASLNIAHYRNSADYEESCYMVGQPTPYFSGLTEDWVKNVLNGTVFLGARGAVMLPEGGNAGLLQANANSMPKEAMELKERQMVALGAKLVEQKTVQRTATEASQEEASESSTLAASARNVANAIKWALEWCGIFVGTGEAGIKFELNTDFDISNMSAADRAQLIKEWQSGAITFEEMRAVLRKGGVATLDDDEAKTKISEEIANAPGLNNDPNNPPNNGNSGGNNTPPNNGG